MQRSKVGHEAAPLHKAISKSSVSDSILPPSIEIDDKTRQCMPQLHLLREVPLRLENILNECHTLTEASKTIEGFVLSIEEVDHFD